MKLLLMIVLATPIVFILASLLINDFKKVDWKWVLVFTLLTYLLNLPNIENVLFPLFKN